ncbi:MAG: DNA-binding NtrC family response regulator [Polyangiales bacterium]|jgi:DNA-binding NtrC family response regulator
MTDQSTSRLSSTTRGIPIRTLTVDVVEGPDMGASYVATSETVAIGTADGNDLVLNDSTVSRYHVELSREASGVLVTDQGSTNGTVVGSVRIERGVVPAETILTIGRSQVRIREGNNVTVELHQETALGGLRGRSRKMRRLMAQTGRAAIGGTSVLLVGESGTGKELIAQALHDLSPRAADPFEVVDCGSLSPNLIASELFGHERGAFTGAERRHIGAFERANGGTLFLDEIGELPAELQPTLLGALERRRFRRVGGREDIAVDVRGVAATNRDLRADVNSNSFRLDLYYRLAILTLRVPTLRDRPDDIPLLVEHFLEESGREHLFASLFDGKTLKALQEHHWPGNVRELRNLVEATVAMGETPDLDEAIHQSQDEFTSPENSINVARINELPFKKARIEVLRAFEVLYLAQLLERCTENVSEAARVAGIDRSYLFSLLKRHKLR